MPTVDRSRAARRTLVLAVATALLLAACSDDDDDRASGASTPPSTVAPATTTTVAHPAGPAADLGTALSGGKGVYVQPPTTAEELDRAGYVEREYAAVGTATAYRPAKALTHDGRWTFTPDGKADYRTRVVVRAPEDAGAFSGNVVVEWLNVSGGVDADPEWASLHEEIERAGDVWVGVSAQRIGVEGGPVIVKVTGVPGAEDAGKGIKRLDADRYGTLVHPGDGFSFDMFTQVARALRSGEGLDGLQPQRVIAAGESQSAFALVTYYNGVQPLTEAFDGFFVHSRGGAELPIVEPGKYADIAGAMGGVTTIFRTDVKAPVMDIQTEADLTSVLNSYAARQPDNDRFRLWEVAGTAHADAHLVGAGVKYIHCGVPINNGPMHIVAKAAYRALRTWSTDGTLPKQAPRLDVAAGPPDTIQRDGDGIALGGIRTPPVDVPVSALSGAPGPDPSTICLLLGSAKPLSTERLAQLYPSRAEYDKKFEAATDATIKAGFALPDDRDALLAFADPSGIAN